MAGLHNDGTPPSIINYVEIVGLGSYCIELITWDSLCTIN
jgi:hypothetical protein